MTVEESNAMYKKLFALLKEETPNSQEIFDVLVYHAQNQKTMLYIYLEHLVDKANFSVPKLKELGSILGEGASYWMEHDKDVSEEYALGATYCGWKAEGTK
mgnify:CR=1 FL=1